MNLTQRKKYEYLVDVLTRMLFAMLLLLTFFTAWQGIDVPETVTEGSAAEDDAAAEEASAAVTFDVPATRLLGEYRLSDEKVLLTNDLDTHIYSTEENDVLDAVLAWQVSCTGYRTRAGAVQAARFLALEFPYRIPYFYENGRLDNHGSYREYCDGEGRYYHTGLYLSKDRKDDVLESEHGPAVWGEYMYSYPAGSQLRNGLDCSGFICWALYNAGYDPGDVGSGYSVFDDDLSDICVLTPLSRASLAEALPGDLVFYNGHVGMIIGIDTGAADGGADDTGDTTGTVATEKTTASDDTVYYIAEAYDPDLHVLTYTTKDFLRSRFTHIGYMGDYYGSDGLLTMMWPDEPTN